MFRSHPVMLLRITVVSFLFIFGISLSSATDQPPSSCSGSPNLNPILDAKPTLLATVENGKRYIAGSGNNSIILLHLYGTPYEMGYAQGLLLREDLHELLPLYESYLENSLDHYLSHLPKDVADFIIKWGLHAALDLTWLATRDFTPQRFKDEMKGIADSSGVDEQSVIRMNMIPELIKASCSILGANGKATIQNGGSLFQLRALDWDAKAPIKKWPTVTVYHPNPGDGFPFANVGWPAFIGSLSGYSASPIALSQKYMPTPSNMTSRVGIPWNFLLRDLLQYADEVNTALSILIKAPRTCSMFLGIGSGKTNSFAGVEYAYSFVNIFDDMNQPHYEPGHPYLPGVVYWDKYVQPSHHECFPSLLQMHYGALNAENIIQNIVSVGETGDAQCVMYDFERDWIYVAYPSPSNDDSNPVPAYSRSFVRFDMKSLFSETME